MTDQATRGRPHRDQAADAERSSAVHSVETRLDGVRRIAVLRANGIGDYIVCIPALAALRAAYPEAELMLLGLPWHAAFLTGRPGPVDSVVVLPPVPGINADDGARRVRLERFLTWIRKQRLDLAIQLHGGGRHSNPFVRQLGAGLTAGLRAADAEPLDRWTHYSYYQHEALRFLEVVALVGAHPDRAPGSPSPPGPPTGLSPTLAVTHHDREGLDRIGHLPKRLIALHPGARDPRRRWPTDRFAAVGDALASAGYSIAVTGAAAERDVVGEVVAQMRAPAQPLCGELGLGGLAALYQQCRLVVANDTGPRHVAEAVGAATVGIYWCGNLVNAGPLFRGRHRPLISWTTACPVCGVDCVRSDRDAARCRHDVSFVTDVPVDAVISAAAELLASSGVNGSDLGNTSKRLDPVTRTGEAQDHRDGAETGPVLTRTARPN